VNTVGEMALRVNGKHFWGGKPITAQWTGTPTIKSIIGADFDAPILNGISSRIAEPLADLEMAKRAVSSNDDDEEYTAEEVISEAVINGFEDLVLRFGISDFGAIVTDLDEQVDANTSEVRPLPRVVAAFHRFLMDLKVPEDFDHFHNCHQNIYKLISEVGSCTGDFEVVFDHAYDYVSQLAVIRAFRFELLEDKLPLLEKEFNTIGLAFRDSKLIRI